MQQSVGMASDLATERYLRLIDQLADTRGRVYGWKSDVARTLGVSPAYINQLASGKKARVGAKAVNAAVAALGIDPRFFFDRAFPDRLADAPATPRSTDPAQLRRQLHQAMMAAEGAAERALDAPDGGGGDLVPAATAFAGALENLPVVYAATALRRALGTGDRREVAMACKEAFSAVMVQDLEAFARARRIPEEEHVRMGHFIKKSLPEPPPTPTRAPAKKRPS